jgi:succinyl-CoA synthetase beta subunit
MAQLHEYQAKKILAQNGVEISRGQVAFDAKTAKEIAERLGGKVVVKAQIHSTSRAASGGIRFANSADEAEKIAVEMLGKEIAGNLCEAVLIDEKAEIEREFYLGFIVDTVLKRPTLLFSDSGGSGIEERADSMIKFVCSIRREPTIEEISAFVQSPRFSVQPPAKRGGEPPEGEPPEGGTQNIAEILLKLYRVAKSCEARTAEINPLALLKDGRLIALDARISVDDYAVFRHEDLNIEMARELGHTPTKLEKIAWEIERDDFRGTFYFVEILSSGQRSAVSGQKKAVTDEAENTTADHRPPTTNHFKIGFHGAGGGGSMASLDAAQRNGLSPACYVDTSGNPPASKVYRAAKIILSIPRIKGYFLSGSGVASQEQFGLARAVLKAFLEVRPNIPAVLRLGGNGEEYAKELVEKYAKFLPAPMEAHQKQHSADFCAARLKELISSEENYPQINTDERGFETKSEPSAVAGGLTSESRISSFKFQIREEKDLYKFKTRTGEITFDHSIFAKVDAAPIVEACPVKILKLDERNLPVLAIEREDAMRGKCIECLACEFASWEFETGGVKIYFPIKELI